MVIDARVEAVVVVALRWRRNEVLKRHIAIRQWKERRDRTAHRVDEKIWNDIVVECLASERIFRQAEQSL